MPHAHLPRSLVLHLSQDPEDGRWVPEELIVGGQRESAVGPEDIDGRSKRSIDALCLLILLTYIHRTINPGKPDSIPEKFHKALEVLHGTKRKDLDLWQLDLFGSSPFGDLDGEGEQSSKVYLRAFKIQGRKYTRIPENVSIKVVEPQQGSPDRELQPFELHELTLRLAELPPKDSDHLSIDIPIVDGATISSRECNGSLKRVDRFSIIVKKSPTKQVCVFWLGGDDEIDCLYPESPFDLIYDEAEVSEKGLPPLTALKITASKRLEVPASRGVEICLVLLKTTTFQTSQLKEIEGVLSKTIHLRDEVLEDHKPRFQPLKIPRKGVPRRGIRPVASPSTWHRQVQTSLKGLADQGYAFEIPFR